jgi:4-phosphopantoate--beta-alanine ligase
VARSNAIARILRKEGSFEVLGVDTKAKSIIYGISSNRKFVDKEGIMDSDTVLVALEDGDRTESLVRMGKKVISVDLNPLSRTAIASNVTIIDNIVRALPNMMRLSEQLVKKQKTYLQSLIKNFDNKENIRNSLLVIKNGI